MRQLLFIVLFALVLAPAIAQQQRIQSREIIALIEASKPVEYNNVIIEGELDLTDLKTRYREHSPASWFDFNNDLYEAMVEVPLKFTNCTFQDDVLAYYHIERKDETYIAHFEQDVAFINCRFEQASEFKYSKFKEHATFTGCTFTEEANFKYAKFSEGPQFDRARFQSTAEFKYAEFPPATSFEQATFRGLADFKYSKFSTPLNMKRVSFDGSEDFKYTKVDGRSFTSYLVESDR